MTAVFQELYRYRPSKTETEIHPFRMVSLFCGAGLLVSLVCVTCGFDLGMDFLN
jgi:hypothetical protein